MAHVPTRDEIRKAVIQRAEMQWERTHSPSLIGRLLAPIFGGNKLQANTVIEYESGDVSLLMCQGKILNAWSRDETGLHELDPQDASALPVQSLKHVLGFHISSDNLHVIANEMESPQQGTLLLFEIKQKNAGIKLAVSRTRLVLGGHAI